MAAPRGALAATFAALILCQMLVGGAVGDETSEVAQLRLQVSNLRSDATKCDAGRRQVEATVASLETRVASLEAQLQSAREALSAVEAERDAASAVREGAVSAERACRERETAAETRAASAEAQLQSEREKAAVAGQERDAALSRAEEVKTAASGVDVACQEARDGVAACEAAKRALAEEVAALKKAKEDEPPCECDMPNPREKSNKDMPDAVRQLYEREKARQRRVAHSDADSSDNGPKEISLFCAKDMQIGITDLSEDEREEDECMVLNINAPGVNSRLVLFCDGSHDSTFDEEEDSGDNAHEDSKEE